MNPISRLRIRERWLTSRLATEVPFRTYSPSDGESSRPINASNVDLPEPDGPAMETYSPFRISMCTPESAFVSNSTVEKVLVMFPIPISIPASVIRFPFTRSCRLFQFDPVVLVPARHVRQDDLVAFFQS